MPVQQIQLSDTERNRLMRHIWDLADAAKSDHRERILRFRRYYRMWRGLIQSQGQVVDGKTEPDFQYPLLKWITYGQWARVMQSLLGDDKEIVARATSPDGEKAAEKAGHYQTWRFFEYMRATTALSVFCFRALLFGRGHAECQYVQEYTWMRKAPEEVDETFIKACQEREKVKLRWERNSDGSVDYEELTYDGPRLTPLWPSELIVPSQDGAMSIDDFDWRIRRRRVTPQELLDGEIRGKYVGIRDNWQTISGFSETRQERDAHWDDEKWDKDQAEGVMSNSPVSERGSLDLWEWYGKWRLLKGKQDGRQDNLDRREDRESDLIVSYLPACDLIVGCEDALDSYGQMKKRHPIVDLSTTKDGSYWGPGLGELTEDIQNEQTINYRLFREAGMLSVGPIIFYKPGSAFDPKTFEYKPRTAIPSADPSTVNAVQLKADLSFTEQNEQRLKAVAELTTGYNDFTAGRGSDRPNAPRTASGQAMLIEEGNTRITLDMNMIRDDFESILKFIWDLDRSLGDDEVYFRVTGDDPPHGYTAVGGFAKMTADEREHPFSFSLKFATSVWSREAKKERILQLYELSLKNPIVVQNPRALWAVLNRVWKALGESGLNHIIPEPPEMDVPMTPEQEWRKMMDGEETHPNPLDDDAGHIASHRKRLEMAQADREDRRDFRMEEMAIQHIKEHYVQQRQKALLEQMLRTAVEQNPQLVEAAQQQIGAQAQPQVSNGATSVPSPQPGPAGPIQPPNQIAPGQ